MTARRQGGSFADRCVGGLTWLCLFVFVLLPVGWPVGSAALDHAAWRSAFGDMQRSLALLLTTLQLTAAALALSLPFSLLLALTLTRCQLRGRQAVWYLLLVATFAPLSLHTGGWLSVVGPMGWIQLPESMTSRWGGMLSAIVVHALAALPWAAALTALGLQSVRPEWEEQGLLVADGWRVLCWITLPVCLPFVLAAAVLAASSPLTDMTVTDLFVVRTFAEEAYTQFESGGNARTAVLLNLPLTVLAVLLLTVAIRAMPQRVGERPNRLRIHSPAVRRTLLAATVVLLLAYVLPIAGLMRQLGLSSVATPGATGGQPQWGFATAWDYATQSIRSTLLSSDLMWDFVRASCSAGLATVLSVLLGWRFLHAGRWVQAGGVVLLCLLFFVPGPVLGLTIIEISNRPGPLGWIYDSMWVLVYAQTVRSLPFCLAIVTAGMARLEEDLLDAARCEGASDWQLLSSVVLPARAPTLALGFLVAIVLSGNELAASKLVAPPGEDPLALRVFQLLHGGTSNEQAAQCLVLLATVSLLALALHAILRRAT